MHAHLGSHCVRQDRPTDAALAPIDPKCVRPPLSQRGTEFELIILSHQGHCGRRQALSALGHGPARQASAVDCTKTARELGTCTAAQVVLGGLAIVILGVAGAAFLRADLNRTAPATDPPRPIPVIAANVEKRDMPIILTGLGTVTALNTATIHSQITGLHDERRLPRGSIGQEGRSARPNRSTHLSGAARSGARRRWSTIRRI